MSVAAGNIGKKAVRAANSIVNFAMLAALLLVIAFGCYALWDSSQIYQAADAARYEVYKPRAEDGGKSFLELQAINPEVFSWITVYGTHIDYPVAQATDNMKYVNTNAEDTYSLSGSIFLDCENSKDFSDFNSILFGHHMEKEAMFGEIGNFSDQDYFNARLYGNLHYDGTDHGLEFFAFLHTDAYDTSVFSPGVQGREAQQVYLDGLLSKATFMRDIGVGVEDRIVLLSTCSLESTNGRDILVAKISESTYEDTFKVAETDNAKTQLGIDIQAGTWLGLPLGLWIGLLAVLAAAIAIVIYHRKKRFTQSGTGTNNK